MLMFFLGLVSLPTAFYIFCKWQEHKFNLARKQRQMQRSINQKHAEERRIRLEKKKKEDAEKYKLL